MRNMLERELWKRLPMMPGSLPDLAKAMEAPGHESTLNGSFEHWAERGNSWSASSQTLKQVAIHSLTHLQILQCDALPPITSIRGKGAVTSFKPDFLLCG